MAWMLDEVTALLDKNLDRVKNLVSLYRPSSRGRSKTKETDLLRAAVVLLHASMEDCLRSLLKWKVDTFDADTLKNYGFRHPADKISLQELHAHRGKTVDKLIHEAVTGQLDRQSYNDLGEVKRALERCGIDRATVKDHEFGKLPEMILRRHDIVHKADRTIGTKTPGKLTTRPIKPETVRDYLQSVKNLRDLVSRELGDHL